MIKNPLSTPSPGHTKNIITSWVGFRMTATRLRLMNRSASFFCNPIRSLIPCGGGEGSQGQLDPRAPCCGRCLRGQPLTSLLNFSHDSIRLPKNTKSMWPKTANLTHTQRRMNSCSCSLLLSAPGLIEASKGLH